MFDWAKDIYKNIQESNDNEYKKEISFLKEQTKIRQEQYINFVINMEKQLDKYVDENASLKERINTKDEKEALEIEWNNKRQQSNYYRYKARPAFGSDERLEVDPRIFLTECSNLSSFSSGSNDTKALKCFNWVNKNIIYKEDFSEFKGDEIWLFPFETLHLGTGDCEDGAILMANMMLKSGIPDWRIRLNAGSVKGGGHCWLTYLRELDNKWIILDWCYWPNESKKGLLWKDAEKYYDIWFSFNKQFIFKGEKLDR